MATVEKQQSQNIITVLSSDATLRTQVSPDHPDAQYREYETSDGTKGHKYESVFKNIEGIIDDIEIREGDYGKQLFLHFAADEGGEEQTLVLNTKTPFGEDTMKRLPNIDFSQPVRLSPYSFEDDKGKLRKGMSIKQNDEKVQNFFWDTEQNVPTNGMPQPEGDVETFDSDDWSAYFTKVRKFLIQYTTDYIVPKLSHAKEEKPEQTQSEDTSEISPEDVPF